MDVTPLVRKGTQIIQSYSGGRFKVSGAVYDGAVIVRPEGTTPWEFSGAFEEIGAQDFDALAAQADEIDVVLLGTGNGMKFFPPILKDKLKSRGLMIEAMDTGAACRTYNVLMAEGRRVAAVLLPF